MFKDNLYSLRKLYKLSQEELAEKLEVSRQTISKWETGEAMPDIEKGKKLAEILNVSLDDLVNYEDTETMLPIPPKGKHAFGIVTIGDKGQIVIPAKARKLFDLKPGDGLLILGDEEEGLAMIKEEKIMSIMQYITQLK